MTDDLKVSIIIPVFNVEDYIEKCIKSVLEQTYDNLEVILIDDGSSDDSGIICDNFAKLDARVIVIHKTNSGVSDARNYGLTICTGDYVCFMDSDDWIEFDYISLVISYIKKYNPDILFDSFVNEYADGKTEFPHQNQSFMKMNYNVAMEELCRHRIFGWAPFATFYKKHIIKGVKFSNNICFGEDLLFKYKSLKNTSGDICYLPLCKYHYLIRDNGATKSYNISKKSDDIKVLNYIMEHESLSIKELIYYNEYIARLLNYVLLGINSSNAAEIALVKGYRETLLSNFCKLLMSEKLPMVSKIKLLFIPMPKYLISILGIVYRRVKGFK